MQSGYKTTFENIASVLFTAELYSLIPTTRRHHSRSGSRIFICEKKKGKFFLNRNTCGQQEKKTTNGRAVAGRCFIKKTRSNHNPRLL